MAKDDYFVVVCKILAYLYSCMKNGSEIDFDMISFEKFEICESYWNRILINMYNDGLIEGISIVQITKHLPVAKIDPYSFMITSAGIQYLHENSMMSKALSSLKDSAGIFASIVSFIGI